MCKGSSVRLTFTNFPTAEVVQLKKRQENSKSIDTLLVISPLTSSIYNSTGWKGSIGAVLNKGGEGGQVTRLLLSILDQIQLVCCNRVPCSMISFETMQRLGWAELLTRRAGAPCKEVLTLGSSHCALIS